MTIEEDEEETRKYTENFGKNIKFLREQQQLTQEQLSKKIKISRGKISHLELGRREPNLGDLKMYCDFFGVGSEIIMDDLRTMKFDNALQLYNVETIQIPVLGKIHAGVSIEAQKNIINYIDIPKSWTNGKVCYGLLIDGDCMEPKYSQGDIVIFKSQSDCESGQDCAVAINGDYEATFKKVIKNEKGLILQPYNSNYEMLVFSNEEIDSLPIKIMGIAFKKFGDV